MSIIIDTNTGSKELQKYISIPSVLSPLTSADFMFIGNGENNSFPVIGIERKTIHEILAAINGDNRLVGVQLPNMNKEYDVKYLIIEGIWRDNNNILEILDKGKWITHPYYQKPILYSAFKSFIESLIQFWGVYVDYTPNKKVTGNLVSSLYIWWNKKWEDHESYHGIYIGRTGLIVSRNDDKNMIRRKIASVLPGIGWKLSLRVANHFKTIKHMINADVSEWEKIEGIGKGKADKIKSIINM